MTSPTTSSGCKDCRTFMVFCLINKQSRMCF
jgi:hypothetical protein